MPCIVYSNLSDFEIVKLATEDNDLNALARPVAVISKWREYHRLTTEELSPNPEKAAKGKFWTKQDIEEATGENNSTVGKRIRYYNELPKKYWSRVGSKEEVKQAKADNDPSGKCFTETHLKMVFQNLGLNRDFEGLIDEEEIREKVLDYVVDKATAKEPLSTTPC